MIHRCWISENGYLEAQRSLSQGAFAPVSRGGLVRAVAGGRPGEEVGSGGLPAEQEVKEKVEGAGPV